LKREWVLSACRHEGSSLGTFSIVFNINSVNPHMFFWLGKWESDGNNEGLNKASVALKIGNS